MKATEKLTVSFDDLVEACKQKEQRFLDLGNMKIIDFEKENCLALPFRSAQVEKWTIDTFSLYQRDWELVERIKTIAKKRNALKIFHEFLEENPKIKIKWEKFRENDIRNHAANWLFDEKLELEDDSFLPEMKIRELTEEEIKNLPREILDFAPQGCLDCDSEAGFKSRFFRPDVEPENALIDKQMQEIMKEKFNILSYGETGDDEGTLLSSSQCLKCSSFDVVEDY